MLLEKYGDIVELNWKFSSSIIEEIEQADFDFTDQDRQVTTHRYVELLEHLDKVPSIIPFVDKMNAHGGLNRCRLYKLDRGSFFAPHRDHMGFGKNFRLMIPLNNTDLESFTFFYDDRLIHFKERVPYYINTAKVHGSTTYKDGTYHLICSLKSDEWTVEEVLSVVSIY